VKGFLSGGGKSHDVHNRGHGEVFDGDFEHFLVPFGSQSLPSSGINGKLLESYVEDFFITF
jgi:hypothetical protein